MDERLASALQQGSNQPRQEIGAGGGAEILLKGKRVQGFAQLGFTVGNADERGFKSRYIAVSEEIAIHLQSRDPAFVDVGVELDGAGGAADCLHAVVSWGAAEIPIPAVIFVLGQSLDGGFVIRAEGMGPGFWIHPQHLSLHQGDELLQRQWLGQMFAHIGHAAGHRFHSFVAEFEWIGFQGCAEVGNVAGKEDGAMLLDLVFVNSAGVAGELHPFDGEVVASLQLGIHTQIPKDSQHRRGVFGKSAFLPGRAVHYEAEVKVTHVVKNGPATGEAPHHGNLVPGYPIQVDLRQCVLVAAHNDGRRVAVEQEYVLRVVLEDMFLAGDVERRPVAGAYDQQHSRPGVMAGGWGNSSRFVFIRYCFLAVEVAFIFLVISRLSLTMIFAGRLLSMAISVLG